MSAAGLDGKDQFLPAAALRGALAMFGIRPGMQAAALMIATAFTLVAAPALCGLALLFCLTISSADAANDDQYCSQWTFGQTGTGANSVTNITQDNGWQVRIFGFRLSPDGSIAGDARAVTA